MGNLYTKTGDKGQTGLVGGSRVKKTDLRVECYGTVDEMSSALGFARSISQRDYVKQTVYHIQERLFSFAAEVASDEKGLARLKNLIDNDDVAYLEKVVDQCSEINGPQTEFVIPGANPPAGALHLARTVVRRGERALLRLSDEQSVRSVLTQYLNRLSDATYALARLEETLEKKEKLIDKVEKEVLKRIGMESDEPLTLDKIHIMAARAVEKAEELGVAVVFSVVDGGGNTLFLQRMEDSFVGSIDLALNKAYTANAFKMGTHTLGKSAKEDGPLFGIGNSNNGRIVLFGGGIPYRYLDKVVGGIGVSGGTVEQDMEIVHYALGKKWQEE